MMLRALVRGKRSTRGPIGLAPDRRTAPVRRAAQVFGALVLAVLMLLASARRADAHAVVTASVPADRATLESAPSEVRLTFSESVSISLGGIEVLDGDGNRVDDGTTEQAGGDTIRVALRDGLGNGTYIANYRIVSADGHAIAGAVVFGVGVKVDEARAASVTKDTDPVWEVIAALARFAAYAGALGGAGIAFFLAFIGDGGPGSVRLGRFVRRSALLAASGTLVGIVAQAVLATGKVPPALADPEVLRDVLAGGLGWQTAAVLAGLAGIVFVPVVKDLLAQVLALYGGLLTTGAFVLWGHATEASQKWAAMTADVAHAAVAAFWFGGVIALVLVLRRRMAGLTDPGDAEYAEAPILSTARVVVRFSTGAAVSVAVLWIAGSVMAWETVGSFENLVGTGYGRVLLVKVVLVLAIVAVAAVNRFRLVPAIVDDAEPPGSAVPVEAEPDPDAVGEPPIEVRDSPEPAWRKLTSTLRLEAIGLIGVLLLTGFLVSITPPTLGAGQADQPVTQTTAFGDGELTVVVSPAVTGVNSVHLTFTDATGRPVDAARSVTVELSLAEKNIGPIPRQPVKAGTGHFSLEQVADFAVAGTWTVTVIARVGEFDVKKAELAVPIRKA